MGSVTSKNIVSPAKRGMDYQQIASRFDDPRDCLTAHLMLECAETLAGIKPANLVSLVNRVRPCGKNLYTIWHNHHQSLADSMNMLRFRVLQTSKRALLLFCYHPGQLDKHLAHAGIRILLGKAGYDISLSSKELLTSLAEKIANSTNFPHEIGLFIGYPAKDVAAFMGLVDLPFTCQGPWKIYGNPDKSICLANSFRDSRKVMVNRLKNCGSPHEYLATLNNNSRQFFYPCSDKSYHYQ